MEAVLLSIYIMLEWLLIFITIKLNKKLIRSNVTSQESCTRKGHQLQEILNVVEAVLLSIYIMLEWLLIFITIKLNKTDNFAWPRLFLTALGCFCLAYHLFL